MLRRVDFGQPDGIVGMSFRRMLTTLGMPFRRMLTTSLRVRFLPLAYVAGTPKMLRHGWKNDPYAHSKADSQTLYPGGSPSPDIRNGRGVPQHREALRASDCIHLAQHGVAP